MSPLADRDYATHSALYWARFEDAEQCFEHDSQAILPVHVVDVPEHVQGEQVEIREGELSNMEALEGYLEHPNHADFKIRFISICQKYSWSRLQITKSMLKKLVEFHDIEAEFLDVPLCFFERMVDIDQGFCVPWMMSEESQVYKMFYTFRYAEYKGHPNEPWVVRQSGFYHQYNAKSKTSLFILLNAVPDSVAHKRMLECLKNGQRRMEEDPLWLHSILHASYSVRWREYIAEYEKRLLPIADTTTATLISRPLRVSHDTLGKVRSLESRFILLPTVISSFIEVLDGLELLSRSLLSSGSLAEDAQRQLDFRLDNARRQSRSFIRTAKFLQQRSNNTATLLADTLAFRNQGVSQEQNMRMLILTRSAVFITIITLVYLPWTLVTGIFGMEFFELDPQTRGLVTSPKIWIYFATAAAVTVVTIFLYYVMLGFPQIRRRADIRGSSDDIVPENLQRGYTDLEKDV